MATNSYIPANEEDFNEWQLNFMSLVSSNLVLWSIAAGIFTALQTVQTGWDTAYAAGRDEANPTSSQRRAKNDSHTFYEKELRKFVRTYITNNPVITNADKVAIGVTVPDGIRTRSERPGYAPKEAVDGIKHLRHIIRITDPTNPLTRSKPKGVRGIRVLRYVGAVPPRGIADYTDIGTSTKFLFKSDFSDADMGKTAWYISLYENTRGETGPPSDPVSAVIA
jgi:hypothetical protein